MPLGLLASSGVGEVASPAKVLTLQPNGMWQQVAWGAPNALELLSSGTVSQTPATWVTWDPTRKGSNIALSNGNDTAVVSGTGCVAATDPVEASTAAKYWEVSFSALTTYTGVGLTPSTQTNFNGSPGTTGYIWYNNGVVTSNGVDDAGGHLTFAAGDTARLALINGSLYIGTLAAGWAGDPVAGTGAVVTGITGLYSPGEGSPSAGGTSTATTNFGATAWKASPPTGCTGWLHTPVAMTLTGTLPGGTVGSAYSATLTLGGDFTAPVTIDTSSGSFPAWMSHSVSGNTVTFTGTPTTAETETFTVRVTDSSATPQVATDPQSIVIAAAGAGIARASYTSSQGTTGNWSVTKPTGVAAGDLLLVTVGQNYGGDSGPTGFTKLTQTRYGGNGQYLSIYYRIADGTEGSSFAGQYGSGSWCAVCERYTGAATASVIDTSLVTTSSASVGSPLTLTANAVTTTAANDLLVYSATVGAYSALGSLAFTAPSGYSNATTPTAAGVSNVFVASHAQAAAGSSGSVAGSASFTGTSQGYATALVALKAA